MPMKSSGFNTTILQNKSRIRVKTRCLLTAALLLALISTNAWAQPACHVLDPTGTPLNVRAAPDGLILSTVPNGLSVSVIDRAIDNAGRLWVYVADSDSGRTIGWVFRRFIDCFSDETNARTITSAQFSNAGEASWCSQETTARGAVICSDQRLWDLSRIRLKLFALARAKLSPDDYKKLLDEQWRWVKFYSKKCGVSGYKSSLSIPIDPAIIQCALTESRKRNADLIARLGDDNAIIQALPPFTSPTDIEKAKQALAEKEKAAAAAAEKRRQQEAENALERLHAQAEADRKAGIKTKLSNLGFKIITPIDLDLDWRRLSDNKVKIALQGTYISRDGVEALLVQDKVNPLLRLYTQNASRDARKILLECQEGDDNCPMIIGAEVRKCTKNQGEINETEVPCLDVLSAFNDNE